jgi:hypothetical protein
MGVTDPLYRLDLPSYDSESEQVMERWANTLPIPTTVQSPFSATTLTTAGVSTTYVDLGWSFEVKTSKPNATVMFLGNTEITRSTNVAVLLRFNVSGTVIYGAFANSKLAIGAGPVYDNIVPIIGSLVIPQPGKYTVKLQGRMVSGTDTLNLVGGTYRMTALVCF